MLQRFRQRLAALERSHGPQPARAWRRPPLRAALERVASVPLPRHDPLAAARREVGLIACPTGPLALPAVREARLPSQ